MTSNEIQNITNKKPTDGSIRTPLKPGVERRCSGYRKKRVRRIVATKDLI